VRGPVARGRARGRTLGSWDLGGLMDQLDEIYAQEPGGGSA
jgi:hypothetical protein